MYSKTCVICGGELKSGIGRVCDKCKDESMERPVVLAYCAKHADDLQEFARMYSVNAKIRDAEDVANLAYRLQDINLLDVFVDDDPSDYADFLEENFNTQTYENYFDEY